MNDKTNVKAGALSATHHQKEASSLKIKSKVKAGALIDNHNHTMVQAKTPTISAQMTALKIKSKVKAGALIDNHNHTMVQSKRRLKSGGSTTK